MASKSIYSTKNLGINSSQSKSFAQNNEIRVSIRQCPPKYHDFQPDPAALADSIGISAQDIGFPDKELRPQVLSTSTTHHLFVPICSVEVLSRVSVDRANLLAHLKLVNEKAYGLFLFSPHPGSQTGVKTYQARFFSPGMSGEDPATGSAAGPLSAYLLRHGELELVEEVGRIRVIQGLRVGRECVIDVKIGRSGNGEGEGELQVDFEGGGVEVARGEIVIPRADVEF